MLRKKDNLDLRNAAKEMKTGKGGSIKGTYYNLLIKLAALEAGMPADVLTEKTKKRLALTSAQTAQTRTDILESKNPISNTLHIIGERNTAFAQNKTTYNFYQTYTQQLIPLRDSEKNIADERSNLKAAITQFIEAYYIKIRKIAQEGLTALKAGQSDIEVRRLVNPELEQLFNLTEKDRKELRNRTEKLNINEDALQKKLDVLELETKQISIAAGIKVTAAPTPGLGK